MEEETPSGSCQISQFTSRMTDGLEEDIEKLIQKFVDVDTLRFEAFGKIWKEMKFSLIFIGRPLLPELAEFVEEALHISKKCLTDTSNSIHMRVGALYLVYAIAYKQPIQYFAKLHLVAQQCNSLMQLRTHARQYGHFDILYVMGRLLIDGLIQFHITEREYGAEKALRKYYEGPSDDKGTTRLPSATSIQKTLAALSRLEECSKRYHTIKCRIEGDGARAPAASLSYVDTRLPAKLTQGLRSIMNRVLCIDNMDTGILKCVSEEDTPRQEGESSASLRNRRQEIRDRAQMKTNTLPQHLITVKENPEDNAMDTDPEETATESVVLMLPPKKKSKREKVTHRGVLERRRRRYGVPEFKGFDEF